MKTIVDILAVPGEALKAIRKRPTWRTAFIVITAGLFVIIWLGGCWRDLPQALETPNLVAPAMASPLVVSVVSLGSTALIYLLYLAAGNPGSANARFKTLYSANIHSAIILLLGEIVNFLLVRMPSLREYATPLRGRFPVGLDLMLLGAEDPNIYLSTVLHGTSVFIIWYLCVLALGIRTVTGVSVKCAAVIVFALWIGVVAFALGTVYVAGGSTTVNIRL